jgi:DNA-binding protein YbaB
MFDKAKLMAQAFKLKKALESELTEVEENGVLVRVTGDQKIKFLSINGAENKILVEVVNKAMKKSQESAAKKMQDMGGLEGLLK